MFLHLEKLLESNFTGVREEGDGRVLLASRPLLPSVRMLFVRRQNVASLRKQQREREFFVQGVQLICLRVYKGGTHVFPCFRIRP